MTFREMGIVFDETVEQVLYGERILAFDYP